jgi:hypothetical protein
MDPANSEVTFCRKQTKTTCNSSLSAASIRNQPKAALFLLHQAFYHRLFSTTLQPLSNKQGQYSLDMSADIGLTENNLALSEGCATPGVEVSGSAWTARPVAGQHVGEFVDIKIHGTPSIIVYSKFIVDDSREGKVLPVLYKRRTIVRDYGYIYAMQCNVFACVLRLRQNARA